VSERLAKEGDRDSLVVVVTTWFLSCLFCSFYCLPACLPACLCMCLPASRCSICGRWISQKKARRGMSDSCQWEPSSAHAAAAGGGGAATREGGRPGRHLHKCWEGVCMSAGVVLCRSSKQAPHKTDEPAISCPVAQAGRGDHR